MNLWIYTDTLGTVGTIDARTVRFVTHKDVDDADLDRVVDVLDEIAAGGA